MGRQWLTREERFERWITLAALIAFGWCVSPILGFHSTGGLIMYVFIGGTYGAVMGVHFSRVANRRRRRVARLIIDRRMEQVTREDWTLRAAVAEMDRVINGAYGLGSASRIRTRTDGSKARRAASYTKTDGGRP